MLKYCTVEFGINKIPVQQQPRFEVKYKGVQVGGYVPDLVAYGKLVVDTKVIEQITDHELGQLTNYLKITGLEVGIILNFKRAKLEWKRVVLERHREWTRISWEHSRLLASIRGSFSVNGNVLE